MFSPGTRVVTVKNLDNRLKKCTTGKIIFVENGNRYLVQFENWDSGHSGRGLLGGATNGWFLNRDEFESEEVYNSPLYQLLKEEE
jgi:hypothetical protein